MISRVMSDYDSGNLAGSLHSFVTDPHPPPSSSARRSIHQASCLFPHLRSGQEESALTAPPILLLSFAEVAQPPFICPSSMLCFPLLFYIQHSCPAKLKLLASRSSLLATWNGISFYGDVVLLADLF
ncbi:hypothetical protein ATANTOWER_015480 [Ataeniobius toweri]|uniref:Uncharacterized protein n=1 Tax=Ataeniobius toweri TaxID=208326 RepID=A0ABU7CKU9_9TELE|nr:hypothetical protein [Ataeniobius toweri]